MNTNIEYNNRQILPRLTSSCVSHRFIYNANSSFFTVAGNKNSIFNNYLFHWKNKKTLFLAKEIVSSCLLFNNRKYELLDEVISYIKLNNRYKSLNLDLAISLLVDDNDRSLDIEENSIEKLVLYKKLNFLKKQIIRYPRSSMLWTDQAYLYTLLGQNDKAEKCISIALSLNSYNRFIVRSASRFYLHVGEYDKAIYYIRKSPALMEDPWLLSSEISVNEVVGKKSNFIKKAKGIITNNNLIPYDKSELLGTLATLEFSHGNNRKAKRLMNIALENPNENIIAQAQFLNKTYNTSFNLNDKEIPFQYEGKACYSFNEGNYSDALINAELWFKFQPFSSRPAELYSYISAVFFNENLKAVTVLNQALISSPHDPDLLNNLVFCFLKLNKIQEAEDKFSQIMKIDSEYDTNPVFLATKGMLKIKQGFKEHGIRLYEQAIKIFISKNNHIGHTKILYFYSEALKDCNFSKSKELRNESFDKAVKFRVKEIIYLINKTNKKHLQEMM